MLPMLEGACSTNPFMKFDSAVQLPQSKGDVLIDAQVIALYFIWKLGCCYSCGKPFSDGNSRVSCTWTDMTRSLP